jgi:peptidoglycan-associated lipoprotein
MKKTNQKMTAVLVTVTAVAMLAGSGCASKKVKEADNSPNAAVEGTDLGTSDMGNAMGLETVRFDYDSSLLSSGAKNTLKKDAEILKNNPNVFVQVEGHCDARGGIQYNIALGQRRADAVQHFLVDLGVTESRLTTISYGKERPLVQGDTDEAYAKNRRANLAITKK